MSKKLLNLYKKIPGLNPTISQQFHQQTAVEKPVKTLPKEEWPEEWKKIHYKGYPRLPGFHLPKPQNLDIPFDQVLKQRTSSRDFIDKPLSLQKLNSLLYYSAGENKIKKRFYPSAGARYPLEVYPIIKNVEKIYSGVYHYYVPGHGLEVLWQKDIQDKQIKKITLNQDWISNWSVILAVSLVFARNQNKYKQRGYRYMLIDLGHLCQNIYLTSAALGIGCCSIGGFRDDLANKLIDLDGWNESVTVLLVLGNIA